MLVFVCGAVLALAIAYILLSSGPYPDVFYEVFSSQPGAQKIAWMLVVAVSLVVLACAMWSNETLLKQRNAAQILESRLRVEEAQKDVDRAMNQLVRTVPDAAIRELQQRLATAEKELSIQQHRSEAGELQALVEEIRTRQTVLKAKLGEAITKRKSIEQLFVEYEGTQSEIERITSGIEKDQKGDSLEARIGELSRFAKATESRFQEIEQSKQMLLDLKEKFDALQARLLPLKDDRSGVKALIHQLNDMCAQLVANIEMLERDGDTSLSDRVKRISENRQELSERMSNLAEELSKLDSSHKDINSLFARLSHELRSRYPSGMESPDPSSPRNREELHRA
jgi:chromosome segregation ATPase